MHFNYYDSDVTQTLQSHGATQKDMDVLRDYIGNPFNLQALPASLCLPLKDEPFAAAWRQYENETAQHGIEEVLRNRFTQFNFPVKTGISNTPQYQQALKKGLLPEHAQPKGGVNFSDPANITLFVHESPAGSIGVILAGKRQDFVTLVQTLLYKNEPAQIPDSLGAFMVSGYNNWDRIRNYKQQWMANQNTIGDDFSWMLEFEQLKKKKELYQDRFIILSSGPYSDIPAADMGMEPGAWREKSVSLRLEHECTHYFTRRVFSSMRKNIWDEILADYMGITAAHGSFNARWFLLFMGLENYPEYRPGGRLEKYVPDSLPESALEALRGMTVTTAENLQDLDKRFGPGHHSLQDRSTMLLALSITGWSALAGPDYLERFTQAHRQVCSRLSRIVNF